MVDWAESCNPRLVSISMSHSLGAGLFNLMALKQHVEHLKVNVLNTSMHQDTHQEEGGRIFSS